MNKIYGVFFITQDAKDFSLEDSVAIASSFSRWRANKYAQEVFQDMVSEMGSDFIDWRITTHKWGTSYSVRCRDGRIRIINVDPIPFLKLDKEF